MMEDNNRKTRIACPLLLLAFASLQALAGGANTNTAAAASEWNKAKAPRVFPAEQVNAYKLTIEASGDEADVYYPQPREDRRWFYVDQFPVVLMMQGAMVDKEYYSVLATSVARQGFVVVVPNQHSSAFNALRYAEIATINEVLVQMRAEYMAPDSPVYGIVDPNRLALMGHSFGGAAVMFAVGEFCFFPFCDPNVGFERPPELQAAVLTASNARSFDFDTTGVPVAIVRGGDEIAVADQDNTYETLETPKALVTVAGANHYGMCDADVPPGARAKEGEPVQALPNAITATRFGYWAGQFLRAHVHNDVRAKRRIYNPAETEGITIVSQQR